MTSCTKCGIKLRTNAKFCHRCGIEIKTDYKEDITPQKVKVEKKVRSEKPRPEIQGEKSKKIVSYVVTFLPAVIGIIIILLVMINISGSVVDYSISGMVPHESSSLSYPGDRSIVFSVIKKPFFLSSDPEVYWDTYDADDYDSYVSVEFMVYSPVTGDVYEDVINDWYDERISVESDVLIFEWINNNETQDAIIYADISYYPDTTWVAVFMVIGVAFIACSFILVYFIIKIRKK